MNLEKQLRKARPKLRYYNPQAWWTILVMAWFNLILGLSFITAIDESKITNSFLIVNDVLTFKVWGLIFISIGVAKLYSILSNRWELARSTLFVGVAVKAAWAVALIIRTLISPGTVFIDLLWITVAMLQMGAYIFFVPPNIGRR